MPRVFSVSAECRWNSPASHCQTNPLSGILRQDCESVLLVDNGIDSSSDLSPEEAWNCRGRPVFLPAATRSGIPSHPIGSLLHQNIGRPHGAVGPLRERIHA